MPNEQQLPFFVYGTLLPDQPNFTLWGQEIAQMTPAKFLGGKLYDMGYYPMLVATQTADTVQGMVITPHAAKYEAVQQRLDALEGYDPNKPELSGYRRRAVDVILANGRSQTAWAYLGQPELVTNKPMVADGDWAAHAVQNQPFLQEWWKAIDTVAGLHK